MPRLHSSFAARPALVPITAVSFPHYFLQATGHLAEQLKTREWIVARITFITEQVVDSKVRELRVYLWLFVELS